MAGARSSLSNLRRTLLVGLLALGSAPVADEIAYTFYRFGDSKKNRVITSSFYLSKRVWSKTAVLLDVELDQIHSPPLPDAVTGASRPAYRKNEPFERNRGQVILGLERPVGDDGRVSGAYYFSREPDYTSDGASGDVGWEFFQKNLSVRLRGQYNADRVGHIRSDGSFEEYFKETRGGSLSVGQLLSPSTRVSLTLDLLELRGRLDDPYRLVETTGGQTLPERHPDRRLRHALSAGLRHMFAGVRAAVHLDYRYYWDLWGADERLGILSHTASIKLKKYVTADWVAGADYRYYTQTGAFFVREQYTGDEVYRSDDFKLRAFDSNNFGLGLTWFLRGIVKSREDLLFLQYATWTIEFFHYFNSQDFRSDLVHSRLGFEF